VCPDPRYAGEESLDLHEVTPAQVLLHFLGRPRVSAAARDPQPHERFFEWISRRGGKPVTKDRLDQSQGCGALPGIRALEPARIHRQERLVQEGAQPRVGVKAILPQLQLCAEHSQGFDRHAQLLNSRHRGFQHGRFL
jgi:hypothetical protein